MTLETPWPTLLPGLAAGIPATFAVAALAVSRARPLRFAGPATGLALALATAVLAGVVLWPAPRPVDGLAGAVRVDLVTGVVATLVCLLAVVIVPYSRRYLDGDPGLARHARALLGVLAAVTTLVVAADLAVIALAWMGTSLGLHALLTFHRDRGPAVVAAHKKFLLSRLADVCLLGALALIGASVGSLDLDAVEAWVRAHEGLNPSMHAAAVLVVLAVALRSAQLPFHGWLIQVMEAPTPVSALLHAGVVNIGGFVLLRLAPLVSEAGLAQALLVGLGMVTAIVASLVMTTRVSVKVSLAWSTCAQMGFMLVQCGLGAWHLALLHLVAHSLYKAHAFASAGSTVERWRAGSWVAAPPRASLRQIAVAAVAVMAGFGVAVASVRVVLGVPTDPTTLPLMLLLGLSIAPVVARGAAAGSLRTLALRTAGLAILYLAWHVGFEAAFAQTMTAGLVAWSCVLAGFALLFGLQVAMQTRPRGRLARTLHPWLFAGLYLDEIVTRGLFRAWPPPIPTHPRATHDPRPTEILEVQP